MSMDALPAVSLRAVDASDIDRLAIWWSDPRVRRSLEADPRPRTLDATRALVARFGQDGSPYSAAFSIDAGDSLVGHIALETVSVHSRVAQASLFIDPGKMHRGYGSAAILALNSFAFERLGVNKIEIEVFEFNSAAIQCYERASYVREGIRRARIYVDGCFLDSYLYALMKDEWLAKVRGSGDEN